MPQLYFSVDSETAASLATEAKNRNISLSRYLARVMQQEVRGPWPDAYLTQVVGSCSDDPLTEPDELELDDPELDGSGLDGSGR